MRIIDLSHTIENNMTLYPGTEKVDVYDIATIDIDDYNEKMLKFTTHTGTHIDCPLHIINHSLATDSMPLETFYGNGFAIDCSLFSEEQEISLPFLFQFKDKIQSADFILLYTSWERYWNTESYFSPFPVLSIQALDYLMRCNIKGVGVDTISVDALDDEHLVRHNKLLNKNIVIIENLKNIKQLVGCDFIFSCFPLKILRGDGSPVRAVAIVNE